MRNFDHKKDLEQVNLWCVERGKAAFEVGDLPMCGMIEPEVACGFLVTTDTNTCFLDGVVSNPKASSEDRGTAITRIVNWALSLATACGYKSCVIITEEKSFIERAEKLGFKHKVMTVGLLNLGVEHGLHR